LFLVAANRLNMREITSPCNDDQSLKRSALINMRMVSM